MEVDMIYQREDASREAALAVGKKMVAAAITAPKGCGHDNVEAVLLDGEEMMTLANPIWPLWNTPNIYFNVRFGASCRIRTNDPEITNHVLWPTELKRRVLRTFCHALLHVGGKAVQRYYIFFN